MAIAVVHSKQTPSTASATLGIGSAVAGNILVAFISQTGSATAPKGKDNISGETGWSVNATNAQGSSANNHVWLAIKTAVGGETELNPAVGGAGAIQGITYFELSGCSETVDTIVHADNIASAKTATSPAITTSDAGSVVLAALGDGTQASGAIEAWSASNAAVPVQAGSESSRCWGASYLPGATLSAVTLTSKWTTEKVTAMLVVALKPAAAAGVEIPLNPASSTSAASMALTAPTRVPLEPAVSTSAASAAVTAATQIPLQPAASSSAASADVLNPGPLIGTRAIPTSNVFGVAAKRQWAWRAMATRSKTLNELHCRTQTALEWGEGVEGTNWLAIYADEEYEPGAHRPGAVLGMQSIKNKPGLSSYFTVTGFNVALTAGTFYWIGGVSSVIARPVATEEGKGGTGTASLLVTTKVTYTEPTATTEWQTSPAAEGPIGLYGISGVTIDLAPASSSSSASLAVTAATQIPLAPASSTSAASASLNAPTQVPLLAAASSSAASMKLTAPTQIPLNPASSTSAAQATVTVPAGAVTIPLNPASSSSSATLALTAATRVPLQPASSVSSAGELSISFPSQPEFAGGGGAALAIWTGGGSSPGPTVGSGGAMQAITATGGASS